MQPAAGGSASAGDVAAVLGDLRFVQNNIQQEPHLAYPIYPVKNLPDYCIPESSENQPENSKIFNFSTPTIKKGGKPVKL